jgi:4-hydroxybenzoate polyprenyltransferase
MLQNRAASNRHKKLTAGKADFYMIKKFFSLVRFPHTVFALPFALIGFFLATHHAGYPFSWIKFLAVLGCMVFGRNTALAFNRYADRDIDAKNPRTAQREVPSGVLSAHSVLLFTIVNAVLFIATTYFINMLCFFLSPVALAVIMGYSYTKRFTYLSHLILGLGLSLTVVGAYIAVTGEFHQLPIYYGIAILCWVSGFDIIYALQDRDFDQKLGLYSIPVALGNTGALVLSALLHLVTAFFIIWPGYVAGFGWWYWIGAIVFIGLLVYQHLIVTPNDLSRVNLAFGILNGFASVIFAIFVLLELFIDNSLFY